MIALEVVYFYVIIATDPTMTLGGKRESEQDTHGTDMTLYNIPILVPTCPLSEIQAMEGVSTEMKAPDKKP